MAHAAWAMHYDPEIIRGVKSESFQAENQGWIKFPKFSLAINHEVVTL